MRAEPPLADPESNAQTSLFLTALPPSATEDHVRHFYQTTHSMPPSALKSVVLVPASKVAFVNFTSRAAAETAAIKSASRVVIDGQEVKVQWGRSRPKKGPAAAGGSAAKGGPLSAAAAELKQMAK